MKKLVFFITHKTLSEEHANATFWSLSNQSVDSTEKFDCFYIYNTHQNELSNFFLLELYEKYNLGRFFKEVRIFDYDNNTPKALGADISTIGNYVLKNYSPDDRVLLLKSDCVLSKNYLNDLLSLDENRKVYFVAPFVCAKERIKDDEIFEYAKRDSFVASDEITFFVEDQTNSSNNDFQNRKGVNVTDQQIKFTSCYVIGDFSCHYLTASLMTDMIVNIQSWGGVKFYNLTSHFVGTDKSFVIHKYHSIISENRQNDREGPVKDWLNS